MGKKSLKLDESRDAFDTIALVNLLLRYLGLEAVGRDKKTLKWKWSLRQNVLRIGVATLLNSLGVYAKVEYTDLLNRKICINDGITMLFLVGYFHYIYDLLSLRNKGDISLRYYKIYTYIDNIIGNSFYSDMEKYIKMTFKYVTIVYLIDGTYDFIAYTVCENVVEASFNFVNYMNTFILVICLLDQLANIVQINNRLKMMGDILEDFYVSKDSLPGVFGETIQFKDRFKSSENRDRFTVGSFKVTDSNYFKMLWFNKVYLMIMKQVDFVNSKYGIRILLINLILLIYIITLFNYIIPRDISKGLGNDVKTRLNNEESFNYLRILTLTAITFKFFEYAVLLIFFIHTCEQTYRQNERIIRIVDFLITNKRISEELKSSLVDFRGLVLSRPVIFHASHFFRLDYSLLLSMASAVVTYTIIFLQNS